MPRSRSPGTRCSASVNVEMLVQAGPLVGLGHLSRSLVLARTLADEHGVMPTFALEGETELLERVWAAGFDAIAWERWSPGRAADVDTFVIDRDGSPAPLIAAIRRRSSRCRIVAMDLPDDRPPGPDVAVNLVDHTPGRPSPAVVVAEGFDYAVLGPEFETDPSQVHDDRPLRVVVCLGGSDVGARTESVVRELVGRLPEACVDVVLGAAVPQVDDVAAAVVRTGGSVAVMRDVRDMAAVLRACDIAVVGGATTAMEAASCGRPAVVVPRNEREARFGSVLAAAGAAFVVAGGAEGLVGLADALLALTDASVRGTMGVRARAAVDGRGRHRVASLVVATGEQ
jgi:spore coat polysaccharide biosynthesis predicted glycosyltransferase SpsG